MKKHPAEGCPVVFRSPKGERICSSSFIHDVCKNVAKRAGLDSEKWHMHRFRDTAATRWLRAGIDVRTVQVWLGHESLATTQKYLEPSKETEKKLDAALSSHTPSTASRMRSSIPSKVLLLRHALKNEGLG